MQLNHGIFDEATISVIACDTVRDTAGIYGAVTRIGQLVVGQRILLHAAVETRERP